MGIRIQLTDDLVLTSDSNQFILNERRIADKDIYTKKGQEQVLQYAQGDEMLKPFAYYGDLRSCLLRVPERALMRSDAKTLKDMFELFSQYHMMLEAVTC